MSADMPAEQALQLGPAGNLAAIWTPPQDPPRPLAVVMLNAGVIHHVGAHRIHVKLARHLARSGYGCLRFDFGGVGDSPTARDALDFRSQAVRDVRAVLDAVEQRFGIRQVVLFGICSGAAHAQAAAVADERVRGLFLVDGYMYASWRGRLRFLQRMGQAYGWLEAGRRVLRHVPARLGRWLRAAPRPVDNGPDRAPQDFDADMRTLVARDVRICTLFTGSVLEVFSHAGQWRDVFPAADWPDVIGCEVEPGLDHTMTLRQSQRWLLERITVWLDGVRPSA